MKLRSLQLAQFKKFDQPIVIDGFSDGLNLIAGPNEMGKSTLLLALRAALFERHGTKSQAIKALQPNHIQGAAPYVSIELQMEDGLYRIEKQFLRRAMARLTKPDGQVAEGHDAEAAIQSLLHLQNEAALSLDKGSPGHFGVILTPQSQSFHQPVLTSSTRHTLQEVIASEVEQLVNQSDVDAILANVDIAALEFVDRRGKPKGRHKEISERLLVLEQEIAALEEDQAALASDRQALESARAQLRSLEAIGVQEDCRQNLEKLEEQRSTLIRRQDIEAKLANAQHRVDQLTMRREHREKLLSEQTSLTSVLKKVLDEQQTFSEQLAVLETDLADRRDERSTLIEAEGVNQQKRRAIEQLIQSRRQQEEIDNALLAVATEVTFDLEHAALDRVALNDQPMERTSETVQVIDGLMINIEGLGRINILPKNDQLDRLQDHRSTLVRSIKGYLEQLDLESGELDCLEETWREIDEETARLSSDRKDLDDRLSQLEQAVQETKTASSAMMAKRQQMDSRLEAIGNEIDSDQNPGDEQGGFAENVIEAEAELRAALDAAKSLKPDDEPIGLALKRLDADIKALRSKIEGGMQKINDAKLLIGRLSATVAVRSERGLDESLDDSIRRREILSRELERYQLDAASLSLLKTTLADAANSAKLQFHAPLAARLTPYIQSLLPAAALEVTQDFGIAALNRGQPVNERFEQLSDGTREQIAILTRLAFAKMLKDEGRPALLVLDDALVFSDEQRLRRMFEILEAAAETMQIIILTCREDRFLDLNAKRLQIEHQADAA